MSKGAVIALVVGGVLVVVVGGFVLMSGRESAPMPGEGTSVGGSAAAGAATAHDWLALFTEVAHTGGAIASAVEASRDSVGASTDKP